MKPVKTKSKSSGKKGTWLSNGTTRKGFPDRILKLSRPLPKGTYVLAKIPSEEEEIKEVFCLTEMSFKVPFAVKNVPVVIRKATPKEIKEYHKKLELEDKGKEYCIQFARELGLEMKLIRVECRFDRSKITFYYTADGRIDFRQLVKNLARALRMRIEMRQIGVRNATALLGGIGYCGKEFCCARFLKAFTPLSIKMAKEQGLILDPNKISGPCGRLLCCLNYEYEGYKDFLKNLPRPGSKISVEEQSFKILKYNIFQKLAYLENQEGNIIPVEIEELKKFVKEHEPEGTEEEEQLNFLEED